MPRHPPRPDRAAAEGAWGRFVAKYGDIMAR